MDSYVNKNHVRPPKEKALLWISAFSSLSIAIFAAIRFYENELQMAVIDSFISLVTLAFFIFVYITHRVKIANIFMAIFLSAATLLTLSLKGQWQLYWLYPIIIAIFYLLPQKAAVIIITITLCIMAIIIYPILDITSFMTIIITTTLTSVFSFVIFQAYDNRNRRLTLLATIDPLTLASNRRALDAALVDIIRSQQRAPYAMSLFLIDLDYFKKINDNYGHSIGDQVLISLCSLLKDNIRALDTLYRYGGEEFIIMPLNTELAQAMNIADKLRKIVEEHLFIEDIKITVSIGVAQYKMSESAEKWISRADSALYKAKKSGRNKVLSDDNE